MDEFKKVVAENITRLRTSMNLTQAQLGEMLNYSDKSISTWERGESIPDVFVLKKIADLGVGGTAVRDPVDRGLRQLADLHIRDSGLADHAVGAQLRMGRPLVEPVHHLGLGMGHHLLGIFDRPAIQLVAVVFAGYPGADHHHFCLLDQEEAKKELRQHRGSE